MTTPSEPNRGEVLAALDAFPNVMKKTQSMWATRECDHYLHSLFMDTRGGTRQGFPMEAAEEIMFLVKFNKYVRALPLSKQLNIPLAEAFRIVDKADQARTTGSPWNDSDSASAASTPPPQPTRTSSSYSPRATKPPKKSAALIWISLLVVLALAYTLLYPILTGGAAGGG